MTWTPLDTGIVMVAVLAALPCALLGNWLVLRRQSMMGDAISHAVLPGLALAFMITGARTSLPMFLGAAAVGLVTALLSGWLHRRGGVEQSAAMGVVFASLFALGLLLIVRGADAVDLDPGCVLYGAIELTPLDAVSIGGVSVPLAALTLAGVLALDALVLWWLHKEMVVTTFDPDLAAAQGIPAGRLQGILMALVAVTVVAAFESVGSIIVIAMLVVPPAAAHMLTDRLPAMIAVSLALAGLSAVLGHVGAVALPPMWGYSDTSTAGMMAVAAGALLGVAALLAPTHGALAKAWRQARLALRIAREDLLGRLYREEEGAADPAGRGGLAQVLLRAGGLVAGPTGAPALTAAGRDAAARVVRAHRLWEAFLVERAGLGTGEVHTAAHRLEHLDDPSLVAELARETAGAETDPHGRPVPGGN